MSFKNDTFARIDFKKNLPDGSIIAIVTTFSGRLQDRNKHIKDFEAETLLSDKGVRLYSGDCIWIDKCYVKTRNGYPYYTITDWHIVKRNGFTKPKSQAEYEKEKNRQRRQIEEELEAEEQDLDEYIENNGEDDCPF